MDLFCKHAFDGVQPLKWQQMFVDEIVRQCAGIPLALEVMGREARGFKQKGKGGVRPTPQEKEKWQRVVVTMKEHGAVSGVFDRIFCSSFNTLDSPHQTILLDLAMLPEDCQIRESDVVDLHMNIGTCP